MVSLAIIFEELDDKGFTLLMNSLPEILGEMGIPDAKFLKFPKSTKNIAIELSDIMEKHKSDTAHVIEFQTPLKINKKEVGGIILIEDSSKGFVDTLLNMDKKVQETDLSNDLVDRSHNCLECGRTCEKVGELNRIGIPKVYCCHCYSVLDKKYKKENWCSTCLNRVISVENKEC